jgi:hypothetical protein
MDCWESFTIADAVTYIKAALDELKLETVNACWNNLWRKAIHDFKGFPWIDGEVKKIIQTAREVGGYGFVDMIDEVEEHIKEHQEVLTNEELDDLVKSSTEEEDEEEEEPAMWTPEKFGEVYVREGERKYTVNVQCDVQYTLLLVYYYVRYYPRFHVTAVGLGTVYPWTRGHYCISNFEHKWQRAKKC